jgi:hypothetical protein
VTTELAEVGPIGRVLARVRLGQREKPLVAEERGELRVVLAERVGEAPQVHVGVDADAFGRGKIRCPDEEALSGARWILGARRERVEGGLGLGESHGSALRRGGASTSASIAAARRLSSTSRSSGGTWSSHSTSVETGPTRRTVSR